MKKSLGKVLVALTMAVAACEVYAAQACKVSMMGRVCFEEGSEAATAAHMKGDAVAEAKTNKNASEGKEDGKKLAEASRK